MRVEPLRVLMVDVPGMLQDILVAELEDDPQIELLISEGQSEWLASMGRFHPEVVIAACNDASAVCADGTMNVYLLGPDGGAVTRVELRSAGEEMANVSLAQLVASIKARRDR